MANHNHCLLPIVGHKTPLDKSPAFIGHPVALLSIVRLEHVRPLRLHRHMEVRGRIGVRLIGVAEFHVARHVESELTPVDIVRSLLSTLKY